MRARWPAVSFLVAVAALLGAACGDDESAEDNPASALRSVAEARCRLIERCCAAPDREYDDFESCVNATIPVMQESVDALESNGHPFDAGCAKSAAAFFDVLECDGSGYSPEVSCSLGFCGSLNRGNPAGSSCSSAIDCAPGLTCDLGKCVEMCAIPEGQACAAEGQEPFGVCAPGAFCHPTTGVCTHIPKAGEPCPDSICAETAMCSGGSCVALLADGAACSSAVACLSGYCETACRALPAAGEPCPLGQCAEDAWCNEGTCAAPLQLGESCTTGVCETSLTCFQGECVKPPGLGEPCDVDAPPCADEMSCVDQQCKYPDAAWCGPQ